MSDTIWEQKNVVAKWVVKFYKFLISSISTLMTFLKFYSLLAGGGGNKFIKNILLLFPKEKVYSGGNG